MGLIKDKITFESAVYAKYGPIEQCEYYFVIAKDLLTDILQYDYKTAIQGCLLLALNNEGEVVECRVSPTIYDKEHRSFIDIDWNDINITDDEIKILLEIAGK